MSSGTISSSAIQNAFHTLRQYMCDLQDAAPIDSATIAQRFSVFSTKLRLLVNFTERDDVCRWLAKALHARGGAAVPWFRRVSAGEETEVDDASSAKVGHRYVVLEAIKRNAIDLRTFVSTVCSRPGGFAPAFIAFRHQYIDGLRDGMEELLRQIEGHLTDEAADFDAVVETAFDELDDAHAPKKKKKRKKTAKKTARKATRKKAAKKTAKKATRKKAAKKTAKKATRKKAAKKTARKATKKKAARKTAKRRR